MQSSAINIAVIYVNGRYPQTDYTLNKEVESLVQVIKGTGEFGLKDGTKVVLKKGDQLYIPKNESYYFDGALELVYAATPKWTPEQTAKASSLKPATDTY